MLTKTATIKEGWKKVKLGEVVSLSTGKLNSNAAVVDGQYPFFTCAQEIYKIDSYAFDQECVLLGGNNANGIYPLFYFNGKFNAYQRTYILSVRDNSILNYRFLYFLLRQKLEELRTSSELAIFDLLYKPELQESEIKEIKKVAKDLLRKLKETALVLDWRRTQQGRANVLVTIKDVLYEELPSPYDEGLIEAKTAKIFSHIYESYVGDGIDVYK